MKIDTTDYKQVAFKLQSDIEYLKYKQVNEDLPFLMEMKANTTKAFDNGDLCAKEMLITQIDDWIRELEKIK